MFKTLLIHIHILTSNDSKLHLLSTLQYEFLWAWPDKPQDKFKWRYDRRSGNCNLSNCKCPPPSPPKNSGLQRLQRDSNLRPPAIGSNPVEAQKFFRVYLQLLKCSYHCDDHVFIKIDVFPQFKSYSNSVKKKKNKQKEPGHCLNQGKSDCFHREKPKRKTKKSCFMEDACWDPGQKLQGKTFRNSSASCS